MIDFAFNDIEFAFPLYFVAAEGATEVGPSGERELVIVERGAFCFARIAGEWTLLLFTSHELADQHARADHNPCMPMSVPSPAKLVALLNRLYPADFRSVALDVSRRGLNTQSRKSIPEFIAIIQGGQD